MNNQFKPEGEEKIRVLGQQKARMLSEEELNAVAGGVMYTNCNDPTTPGGALADDF
ncbi:hypothetical protein SAMN05428989_4107 [Pseudoxanthomonas sp. GM95]|uniref:hypothetical protein n=1 Tax=Pseudoxanthomonas sp. GM95 TaxID=1881043 RepID=UPI0008C9C21D|nr:hypothetical protein [Pseudoxanthomonas sp. GM95]SEM58135.1 hypothetical protein SAMN05428989_4107 [Pseudoxanthomonas sp. GM95]